MNPHGERSSLGEQIVSLVGTLASVSVVVWAYEVQLRPSTTPGYATWCRMHIASSVTWFRRWIPRVVIPAVVNMVLPEGRGPADEEEDAVIAEWRSKTGDPAKIDQTDDRIYRRVWLTCPSCSGRQPEYIVQGAATRVMRCKACQRVVWTKSPS